MGDVNSILVYHIPAPVIVIPADATEAAAKIKALLKDGSYNNVKIDIVMGYGDADPTKTKVPASK